MIKNLLYQKTFHFLSFCILVCTLILTGCSSNVSKDFRNPVFEKPENEPNWQGPKDFSQKAVRTGWYVLNKFKQCKDAGNLEAKSLIEAQNQFDMCRRSDHDNYNAFWGWGIIRVEQAQLISNPIVIEKYLNDSIKYLQIALEMKSLPTDERPQLELDLANSHNMLGAFYLFSGKKGLSKKALDEASEIFNRLTQTCPKMGMLWELMSYNAFYRKNYKQAQHYCKKAESLGVIFSQEYIDDMMKKCNSEIIE